MTNIEFDEKFNILIGPNGGGKSNLLDIITLSFRKFLLLSYEIQEIENELTINESSGLKQIDKLLEKFIEDVTESRIEIKIKVDKQDIDNIQTMKKYSKEFKTVLQVNYSREYSDRRELIELIDRLNNLAPEILQLNQELTFSITNNQLDELEFHRFECDYLTYLNSLELCLILAKHIRNIELSPIYLYFSPYRAENSLDTQVNLSSKNYHELLADYLEASSKNTASIIKLASLHFAEKKRIYEYKSSIGEGDKTIWNNDVEVKKVTELFGKIGFSWDLHLRNTNKNIYEIILSKQKKEFSLAQASSGEKEIINFILGLFAFNIKGGLLIIDEPELHLHPKWQSLFLDVLIDLAETTNNQFILSTHSISFINKNTISNIIRVYKDNNSSNVVTIDKSNLMAAKDLLHIINSYNNEKIFFADKVVLVEGKSDKLIFEKLIKYYLSLYDKTEIIEVVEVDGKLNLEKYRKFLESFYIENYIIADLDYAGTIGDENIKNLFISNHKKITQEVIARPDKSRDGQALLKVLENALLSENLEEYREDISNLFGYIKSRNRKIKESLSLDEENTLSNFITSKINEGIYILRKGQIEDYLPDGFKTLEKIVGLVEDEFFYTKFLNPELEINFDEKRKELNQIVFDILGIEQPENCRGIKRTERVERQLEKCNTLTTLPDIPLSRFLLLRRVLVLARRFSRKYWYWFPLIIFLILYLVSRILELLSPN